MSRWINLAVLAGVSAWVWGAKGEAQPITFQSDATARYQGGVDAVASNTATDPPFNTPVVADAISNPGGGTFSYAQGFAAGRLVANGSTLQSLSYASGYDPNYDPPNEVRADSVAKASTVWQTSSSTLAGGAPIDIRVVIPMSGKLFAEQYFSGSLGPNDVYAEASASLLVDGVAVYQGSAKNYDPISGGVNSVLTETGAWVGDFTSFSASGGSGLPDNDAYEISTLDVVTFSAALGQTFQVEFELSTKAYSVGPYEALAIADFSSTGSFELLAVDPLTGDPLDVAFTPVTGVPEPCTLWWLLGSPFAWRRRTTR